MTKDKTPIGRQTNIDILRVMLMISVIAAHTIHLIANPTIYIVWKKLTCFGVVGFFIISGYFYKRKKGDIFSFWKKKINSIIIPWIFCSLITYTISFINNWSFIGYIRWILGIGTWYYYITILLVCMIIFKFVNRKPLLIIIIALNGVSLLLEQIGADVLNLFTTPYLNIFNWMGFFALGILLQNGLNIGKKVVVICLIGCLFTGVYIHLYDMSEYFNIFSAINSVCLVAIFYKISSKLIKIKKLAKLGKNTYTIYLLHMQIVQFVCKIICGYWLIDAVLPLIGLTVMIILIYLGKKCSSILPKEEYILRLVGLR